MLLSLLVAKFFRSMWINTYKLDNNHNHTHNLFAIFLFTNFQVHTNGAYILVNLE